MDVELMQGKKYHVVGHDGVSKSWDIVGEYVDLVDGKAQFKLPGDIPYSLDHAHVMASEITEVK